MIRHLLAVLIIALPVFAGAQGQEIDESHPDYYARRYWRNYRNYWGFKHQHTWTDPQLRNGSIVDQIDEEEITRRLLSGEDARDVFKDMPGTRLPGGIRGGRGKTWRAPTEIKNAHAAAQGLITIKNETGSPIRFKVNGKNHTLQPGGDGQMPFTPRTQLLVTLNNRTRLFVLEPEKSYVFTEKDGFQRIEHAGAAQALPQQHHDAPQYEPHKFEGMEGDAFVKVASPRGAIVSLIWESGKSVVLKARGTGGFYPVRLKPIDGEDSVRLIVSVDAEVHGSPRVIRTPMLDIPKGQQVEIQVKLNNGGNRLRVLYW
ncbi:MAG: hypothetical protein COB53_12750 [Elusimicrobia bacterium]|nr:MAG: hypothetical protein COB53_12750 [Elusimicrobiota bacterium]